MFCDDELARLHMYESVGYKARGMCASHLQQHYLLLGLLQLLLGRVQRAIQAASLNRQPHAALFRLQLLTLNLIKRHTVCKKRHLFVERNKKLQNSWIAAVWSLKSEIFFTLLNLHYISSRGQSLFSSFYLLHASVLFTWSIVRNKMSL